MDCKSSEPALTVFELIEKLKLMPLGVRVGTQHDSLGVTDVVQKNGVVWLVNNTINFGDTSRGRRGRIHFGDS